MQPVTPSTIDGTELLRGDLARPRRLELLAHFPGDRAGERLLDGDPGGLAAAGLDPRLGAPLQLLRALGGDRDEAELGIHVPGQDQLAHAVSFSFTVSKLLSISRARSATAPTRQRAALTMLFSCATQASRSSLTIA